MQLNHEKWKSETKFHAKCFVCKGLYDFWKNIFAFLFGPVYNFIVAGKTKIFIYSMGDNYVKKNTNDLIRVRKLIAKYKAQLQKETMREDFGQILVSMLEDEFLDYQYGSNAVWSLIREFDEWCMSYTNTDRGWLTASPNYWKGDKMTREEKINSIVDDVGLNYDYKDFAADCVQEVVTNWIGG